MNATIEQDIKELVEDKLTPAQLERYNNMTGYFAKRIRRISKAKWVEQAIAEVELRNDARIEARLDARERHHEQLKAVLPSSNWKVFSNTAYRSCYNDSGAQCEPGTITCIQFSRVDGGDAFVELTDGWRTDIAGWITLDKLDSYATNMLGRPLFTYKG